ncbi:MAG: hypothetical protein ACRC1H_15060 [Caldilineaceae bacterium]
MPLTNDETLPPESPLTPVPDSQPAADAASEIVEQHLHDSDPDAPLRRAALQPTRPGLSRRGFLLTAAGAGAAALAAACGRDRTPLSSLPTPTATQVGGASVPPTPVTGHELRFPIVRNGLPPAEVAAVATATPTETAAPPTETPTPEPPTATPTPQSTPFPPGPASKLGLHVERNDPQIFELLATGAVTIVKTLELDENFLSQIKATSPNTNIVARLNLPQVDLANFDPLSAARDYMAMLLPIANGGERRRHIAGWEAYNEPIAGNADEMKKLAAFEAERTRLMAAEGLRAVIGNFGTGQPPLEWWEHFLPAVQAAKEHDGWLGLHEYSAPTIYYGSTRADQGRYPGVTPADSGWLTLRYRKVYGEFLIPRGLVIPLVFTEMGVDGLVTARPGPPEAMGWRDFQGWWAENGYGLWGPGAYVEQLVWYDQAMRQDAYVLGGAIFAMATTNQWQSYDITGPAASVLHQYLSVHAPA